MTLKAVSESLIKEFSRTQSRPLVAKKIFDRLEKEEIENKCQQDDQQ